LRSPHFWLLKMKQLAERPPSRRRVILMLVVFGTCLALWGYEQIFGWPELLRLTNPARLPK
jgi:hypothetical protein